ncbi:hypothetical protein NK8_53820 (plasmid) [Caballeronia sp. NK8]|nr:hypothetical protein NK8_53820 [Caballeronia sp. NK8]
MSSSTVRELLGTLQAGSLAWRLTRLEVGDSMLEPETNGDKRNACNKAIAIAAKHAPGAAFELVLHFGLRHDGSGDNFRFFKITRTE